MLDYETQVCHRSYIIAATSKSVEIFWAEIYWGRLFFRTESGLIQFSMSEEI